MGEFVPPSGHSPGIDWILSRRVDQSARDRDATIQVLSGSARDFGQMTARKQRKDEMYEQHPYGMRKVLDQLRPVKKYRNKRVLVAGCGAGSRVFDLYFYGANITAVDQSRSAVEFIRAQFEELGCEAPELVVADLTSIDLPEEAFDYIICYGVLHHAIDPESVLRNFQHALKPDGSLELLVYHSRSFVRIERKAIEVANRILKVGAVVPDGFKEKIEWWDKYENPLWDTYSKREARRLVERSGFEIAELWLDDSPFGQFTTWLLPPVVRKLLERVFSSYKWHIRIEATTGASHT